MSLIVSAFGVRGGEYAFALLPRSLRTTGRSALACEMGCSRAVTVGERVPCGSRVVRVLSHLLEAVGVERVVPQASPGDFPSMMRH